MAYAFVKNVLNIPDDNGDIKEFIKITDVEEFSLYEFLMKIQLLQRENFFYINTCFNLDDILNTRIEQLNADLVSLITDYTFLGDISFSIIPDDKIGSLVVDLNIVLNKEISGMKEITTKIKIK